MCVCVSQCVSVFVLTPGVAGLCMRCVRSGSVRARTNVRACKVNLIRISLGHTQTHARTHTIMQIAFRTRCVLFVVVWLPICIVDLLARALAHKARATPARARTHAITHACYAAWAGNFAHSHIHTPEIVVRDSGACVCVHDLHTH